jgi:hypothetical protein
MQKTQAPVARFVTGLLACASVTTGVSTMTLCPVTCPDQATSVLSVPDFDGNGHVDGDDVDLLSMFIGEKMGYTAFYDTNADGLLDFADVTRVMELAYQKPPIASSRLDQQLSTTFHATKHLLDRKATRSNSFVRMSQDAPGRGAEYMRSPENFAATSPDADEIVVFQNHMDAVFRLDSPEGLLYDDSTGRLLAVEYVLTPDESAIPLGDNFLSTWVEAFSLGLPLSRLSNAAYRAQEPNFFDSDQAVWTPRLGVCLADFNPLAVYMDATGAMKRVEQTPFSTLAECSARARALKSEEMVLFPSFSTLPVWVHTLNPCGVFAACNPRVAGTTGAVDLPLDVTPAKGKVCDYVTRETQELKQLAELKIAPANGLQSLGRILDVLAAEADLAC